MKKATPFIAESRFTLWRGAAPERARFKRAVSLLIGAVLALHSLYLLTQDLFNLGIVLPLLAGLGLFVLGWCWQPIHHWLNACPARQRAWCWFWRLMVLWLITLALFWAALWRAVADDQPLPAPPAALIVLGSGTPNGKPSPTLAARLDAALAQAARYPDALLLVSGGVDFGGTLSEGQIMGDYLRAHGLSPARIVQEERSTNTEENLRFALPLLAQRGVTPQSPVLIVTSDFHTLRARWMAERLGYAQVGSVGAPTPLYVRFNAWLREYFSVLKGWLLGQYA
jgi:uncharacterized SAM-binding protein YcdF (DUF218 family)